MKNIELNRLEKAIRDVPDFPKPGILFKDITPEKFAPTLADAGMNVTEIVWTFFLIMTAIIWIGIKYPKSAKTKKEEISAQLAPQMAE